MDIRSTLHTFIVILIISSSYALAENATANSTPGINGIQNASANQSVQDIESLEALMNLALDARSYALENGKLAAMSAFSDQTSFIRNGMYISAYDLNGVLLADPFKAGQIGTAFIVDDHDAGIIRQLRDIALSGGGIMTPDVSGNGISYYVLDVDGGWWITAASTRVPSTP